MNIIDTGFEGVLLIEPRVVGDQRGVFYEFWRLEEYKKLGIKEEFVQDNISVSEKNVLRGLHYQKKQGQLVTVSHGKIFDVIVDIRPDSLTYKKHFSIVLNSEEPKQLYTPPGFAHGFCVLSDIAIINYKCTQYYDVNQEGGVKWDDPIIGIKWPISMPRVSDRDCNFKGIQEI